MKVFVLAVVTVVAFVQAYDFQDEVYNQIIKQDLDDLLAYEEPEVLINYRRKREEAKSELKAGDDHHGGHGDKCKKRRFRMCCGEDAVENMLEKDKELKRECYKEISGANKEDKPAGSYDPFNCEKVNKTKKEWTCVMQCVGQKKNVIDENGAIKEAELRELFKKEFGHEEWFLKLAEEALPKCVEQAKHTSFTRNKEDPLSCSPSATKLQHCMWREIQLSCPEDKITDAKNCGRIKEKIKKHGIDGGFKHAHLIHDDD